MLDHCSISHKGGIVLWSRAFTPTASQIASSPASPVNSLIREALIEGRTTEKYEKDGYAVKWTFVNDLELIFVVAYQRILQLTYVEDLLTAIRTLFVKLFEPFLATFVASLHAMNAGKLSTPATSKGVTPTIWDFSKAFEGWDNMFDKLLRTFEEKAAQERRSRIRPPVSRPVATELSTPPSDDQSTIPSQTASDYLDEQQISRNVHALKSRLRGRGGRRGGRGLGRVESGSGRESHPNSDSDTPSRSKRKAKAKEQRKWGESAPSETDMAALDFSMDKSSADGNGRSENLDLDALVDQTSLGTRTEDGLYEIKDWEFGKGSSDFTDAVISQALKANGVASAPKAQSSTSSLGALGSLFARFTGSKVLTEDDLKPVLEAMKQHLMKKNVAKDIADKVCEGVGEGLVGKKIGGLQTINAAVRVALSNSITRILTPKTSTDLLLSIRTKLNSPLPSTQQRLPYSMTFVGVNGVGKSTNLSKVAFWLIQNGFRVLIAACDTFRSGAVEQLRVHVRNLSMLGVDGATDSKGRVELFERGYGKDAAAIAKEAITYAKDHDFDVVLIDTAGRMQDNEPLMRALAKLVAVNNPDKIIFVGEALVGNEAVDQLTKFDRALRDFSAASGGAGKGRGIDGMLVTKWDTVDDKVGAALSMTYVTGQPIIFVGTGQTYTDLRQLRVANVVQAILSD
ncbi:P-loop containing nucleoside triphosphate hydrolase protein [Gloeophyllum trabeum ATCC 11539]|uniref:p-loop containing nucleoside triphosphate hydrolase protein n=1 Tax=Gloeophyllum trabeum (strain ATCC 11539 / FP-39264 / Madison 617) TaxID=670483 RepID=S7RXJ3_GLOTA|nr:P-loop containing nucleoside triphosphate hydrolase protein [Gloeophyllum trabeum ATCC 11539]EPQ58074.1 P-loop containing nucleoside triphosphate hydrolase protein [Gloeophyllum trabeum ATCC 11539]